MDGIQCMAIRIGWSNIAVDDFNLVSIKLPIKNGNGGKNVNKTAQLKSETTTRWIKKESISIDYYKCAHALQFEWFCQRRIISSQFDLSASLHGTSCYMQCAGDEVCACMKMWSQRITIHQPNHYANGQVSKHLSNLDFNFSKLDPTVMRRASEKGILIS